MNLTVSDHNDYLYSVRYDKVDPSIAIFNAKDSAYRIKVTS